MPTARSVTGRPRTAGGRSGSAGSTTASSACRRTTSGPAPCSTTGRLAVGVTTATGPLGDGGEVSSTVPVKATVVSEPIDAISVGQWHTCALGTSGSVWCWGPTGRARWVSATSTATTGRSGWPASPVGHGPSLRATCRPARSGTTGRSYCWGENTDGILGVGSTAENVPSPARVAGLPPSVATIGGSTFGDSHYAALTDGGSVWTWGKNDDFETGGTAPVVDTPLRMETGGVQGLAVGGDFTSVLLDSGDVRWWGDGDPTPRVPWTGAAVTSSGGYRPTGPLVPTITTAIPTPADVSTDPPVGGRTCSWRRSR